jgi:DNA-binding IclR family transcriptional regulator
MDHSDSEPYTLMGPGMVSMPGRPQTFGPNEVCHATGVSRATAHRQLDRLGRMGVWTKLGFGQYVLAGAAW